MIKLAPSILAADFSRLAEDVLLTENAGAHLLHIDVMDGHFVPNISFGAAVMKSLCGKTTLPFDVHLMIEKPEKYMSDFVTDSTEFITVHQEVCKDLRETIRRIKSLGVKAGVSVNPETPVAVLDDVLEETDLVLIMSVHPGFGGQKFIPEVLEKVRYLKERKKRDGLRFQIEIDGGLDLTNARAIAGAGADILVIGSAIFEPGKTAQNTKAFLELFSA